MNTSKLKVIKRLVMRCICLFFALFFVLFAVGACNSGENEGILGEGQSQTVPENTTFFDNSEEVSAVSAGWDSFVEYTYDLPAPKFITEKPLKVNVGGEIVLTFVSEKGTTVEELKVYLSELESYGFVNSVKVEKMDYIEGVVYRGKGQAFTYTYRENLVLIDVFKISDSSESAEEESSQIEQGSVDYEE